MILKKDLKGDEINFESIVLDKLYPEPIRLSKEKQKDLIKLKGFLPEHAQHFLDSFLNGDSPSSSKSSRNA
jgi:hypothetical protein